NNAATKLGMTIGSDPLLNGVPVFNCGTNCMRVTDIMPLPGAFVGAYWDDGTILAVHGRRRVDLNMFPADDSVISGSWEAAGGEIITRSIYYRSTPLQQTPDNPSFPSMVLGGSTPPVHISFKNVSNQAVQITGIGLDGTGKGQFYYNAPNNPTVAMPYT